MCVILGITQNNLVLLVAIRSMGSTGSILVAQEKLLESVLVVLAQPPAGKDKERLRVLVLHKASSPHEHNRLMLKMQTLKSKKSS